MSEIKELLISPPFGDGIHHRLCTRVMGSYTNVARRGRLMQILKTVRPEDGGGWINAIGLRNPGIAHVIDFHEDRIYSLAAIRSGDWAIFHIILEDSMAPNIKLNLSCPNTAECGITLQDISSFLTYKKTDKRTVIAKLPPYPRTKALELSDFCIKVGIEYLHFSNTFPTSRGGVSGPYLKQVNLPLVEIAAKRYPNTTIIAGGGIYSFQDLVDYRNAGATHFSLSTIFFNPIRVMKFFSAYKKDLERRKEKEK